MPRALCRGEVDGVQLQPGLDIALEVGAELLDLARAAHIAGRPSRSRARSGKAPRPSPALNSICFDLRAELAQGRRGVAADRRRFPLRRRCRRCRRHKRSRRPFDVVAALKLDERAPPRRRHRDRRQAAEAHDRVKEKRGVFRVARQRAVDLPGIPGQMQRTASVSIPASAGCRQCRSTRRGCRWSSRSRCHGRWAACRRRRRPPSRRRSRPDSKPDSTDCGSDRTAHCSVGAASEFRRVGLGEHHGARGLRRRTTSASPAGTSL